MTAQRPPRIASAILQRIARTNESLIGDLEEQFREGRSRRWYWAQVVGIAVNKCAHHHVCAAALLFAAVLIAAGSTIGWWQTRFAVPVLLGMALTSWKLWRLQRTSLAILYAASVLIFLPGWMIGPEMMPTAPDRIFWALAEVLAGYGIVGVLLVPFLTLRMSGRTGPLAERPIELSLSR